MVNMFSLLYGKWFVFVLSMMLNMDVFYGILKCFGEYYMSVFFGIFV